MVNVAQSSNGSKVIRPAAKPCHVAKDDNSPHQDRIPATASDTLRQFFGSKLASGESAICRVAACREQINHQTRTTEFLMAQGVGSRNHVVGGSDCAATPVGKSSLATRSVSPNAFQTTTKNDNSQKPLENKASASFGAIVRSPQPDRDLQVLATLSSRPELPTRQKRHSVVHAIALEFVRLLAIRFVIESNGADINRMWGLAVGARRRAHGLQPALTDFTGRTGMMQLRVKAEKRCIAYVLGLVSLCLTTASATAADPIPAKDSFRERVAPILERHCVRCHNDEDHKGGLSLATGAGARMGGDSGLAIAPGQPADSLLLTYVEGDKPEMPKNAPPLAKGDVDTIRAWIQAGADWPDGPPLKNRQFEGQTWWSLQALARPVIPRSTESVRGVDSRSPVDTFIQAKLAEKRLNGSLEADRRILIRRLSFDLHGLPPDPEEIDEFVADSDPAAYERLVDRLLASPRFGERWARHWLDVVHYGDTHGYDKDKLRPNAWPYRDYVIRSFNADKPYDRFIQEQIAGDVLWPETVDGITATGFIAAGPWDFIGHAEVPETKTDGKIARNLDRDDMVTTTMNTFCSMTVQCARCHDHKFDPVTQTDYYRLQAVFAALDRADRMFDADPVVSHQRQQLLAEQKRLKVHEQRYRSELAILGGNELKDLDQKIAAAQQAAAGQRRPEYGYHSGIEPTADKTKWVQVDLGREVRIGKVRYAGCWDDFNNIGAGFGFPVRFKLEASNDPSFKSDVVLLVDHTAADFPNPGTIPQDLAVSNVGARYVRMTATRLAPRQNDFIFALAELSIFDLEGKNVAQGTAVTALDSIEAPNRWSRKNLVDGIYAGQSAVDVNELRQRRAAFVEERVPAILRNQIRQTETALATVGQQLSSLPAPQFVYAGMVYSGTGTFAGTGAAGGKPRTIHILKRGDVGSPAAEVGPGIVPLAPGQSGELALPPDHVEGARRVALAQWIVGDGQPLTWRSIANRIWQHHMGRGIVDSPNDFGRMGQLPTHPELLDWLAAELRDRQSGAAGDRPRSLKHLHRQIVTSATYRQTSEVAGALGGAAGDADTIAPQTVDSTNSLYWRANRRKLDAESLRDSMLLIAGKLDDRMGGPGFQDFVIEKPEHSPHFEYRLHDVEDSRSHRRSVYRFLARSQTQPFMTTLDCADPSMIVDKRNETVTALQALALLNNKVVLSMSRHLANRLRAIPDEQQQIDAAFRLALGRAPTSVEQNALVTYAREHGLAQACRVILNLNEFAFVD